MAKAKTTKKKTANTQPDQIVVTYDLSELPTAFHKAGLAGLILLINSLQERGELDKQGQHYELMTATKVRVTFTPSLLQELMDDLYDAEPIQVRIKQKWKGAKLIDTIEDFEEKNGKKKKVKLFVYEQVKPKGTFFKNVFSGEKQVWLRLWRDMLWSIPRGRPTTRIPFNNCAKGNSSGEGESVWADLLKVHKAATKDRFYTAKLSSALFPGAQALDAESVPFQGRAEQTILLHFWSLVVQIYVPRVVERDGSTAYAGYTLAVPEVSDLVEFVSRYPAVLHELKPSVQGFRPAEAVVDIAAEGALALLNRMATITTAATENSELRLSIKSAEYLHLVKQGNNIKTMAAGRVSASKELLARYRELVAPPLPNLRYRNALFRRSLLVAILERKPWYKPFEQLFELYDSDLFTRHPRKSNESESKGPPHFANDAARKLRQLTQQFYSLRERMKAMSDNDLLAVIVNQVVKSYVRAKVEAKSGVKLDKFKTDGKIDWKKVPREFNEMKQRLALNLMLEFRSRNEQAFIDHFAATFFSVTQRLTEQDRLALSSALTNLESIDDLKTLTLLSLSANS